MVKSYEGKLMNPTIKYQGSDSNMISYLSNLWKDEVKFQRTQVDFGSFPKDVNIANFKNTLSKVSDNLVFRGNFGAYDNMLEKEMSLNKKSIIMNKKQCLELYLCLNDLIRYNNIRPSLFDNIKYATIFIKHKGDYKIQKF